MKFNVRPKNFRLLFRERMTKSSNFGIVHVKCLTSQLFAMNKKILFRRKKVIELVSTSSAGWLVDTPESR